MRILYLIRYSTSDHGTALLAAERLDVLNAFTQRVVESPAICSERGSVWCAWIPAGIGVRVE